MNQMELQARSKRFALRVIRLCRALSSKHGEGWAIRDQLVRCGTAVAANYRAACRSRSPREFASRLGVVVEEADETLFWLELLQESAVFLKSQLSPLMTEADELLRIFASARQTTLEKIKNQKSEIENV